MRELNMHCVINENAFSVTLFLTRLLSGLALLYTGVGCLLYYREFLYNAAALGWQMPVGAGIALVVAVLFVSLFLLLGWFTRFAAVAAVFLTAAMGYVFFASAVNRIYVALVVLLVAALLPALLLGPGKISLDYSHAVRRSEKELRG